MEINRSHRARRLGSFFSVFFFPNMSRDIEESVFFVSVFFLLFSKQQRMQNILMRTFRMNHLLGGSVSLVINHTARVIPAKPPDEATMIPRSKLLMLLPSQFTIHNLIHHSTLFFKKKKTACRCGCVEAVWRCYLALGWLTSQG